MTWIETFTSMLGSPLMQRAFLAAVLVGAAAPVVGTFLVQRRMSLMGDGIGRWKVEAKYTGKIKIVHVNKRLRLD